MSIQQAFKWIECKDNLNLVLIDGPEVDERSYVNPQAFQYIDRRPRKDEVIYAIPEIDTRSFILDRNPNALAHLERKHHIRSEFESGIDERSYVSPDAFKYIEGVGSDSRNKSIHSSIGPAIDTRSYVDTEAFRHLESPYTESKRGEYYDRDGIDEESYVPLSAFRHLEYTEEPISPYVFHFPPYGQTDV